MTVRNKGNKLEISERMKMKIKYHLLYVKVYNSVKLSETQISLKKHATSCRMQRTNRNKTLKSVVDTPLHTLKLIDWWLKERLVGQLRGVN